MSRTVRVAAAAVLVVLVAVPAVALGSPARSTANSTAYPDSIGENPLAPDITSTTVSNDDAANLTFRVAISNRPALTPDMVVLVFLDTDQNTATGDPQSSGADYVLQLVSGAVDLFHWSGSSYASVAAPSLTYAYDAGGATIKVNDGELGRAKAFNFVVLAISGFTVDASGNSDQTNRHSDSSPDPGHGTFSYQVQIKVSLTVVAFSTTPKPAMAARPFSVGLGANESDTASGVQQATITCAARIAGKSLRVKRKVLANGIAVCAWIIPKTAKGKRIRGSITLSAQGATVSKSFSQKIA